MDGRVNQGYSEYRYWSPVLGCEAARVSLFDHHGREFFMIIEAEDGRGYRQRRDTAVEAIMTAIDMGLDPGEVRTQ